MDEKKRYAAVNALGWVSHQTASLETARNTVAFWEKNGPGNGPHRVVELVPVPDPLPTAVGSVVQADGAMFVRGERDDFDLHWYEITARSWCTDADVTADGPVTVLFDAATVGGDSDE